MHNRLEAPVFSQPVITEMDFTRSGFDLLEELQMGDFETNRLLEEAYPSEVYAHTCMRTHVCTQMLFSMLFARTNALVLLYLSSACLCGADRARAGSDRGRVEESENLLASSRFDCCQILCTALCVGRCERVPVSHLCARRRCTRIRTHRC